MKRLLTIMLTLALTAGLIAAPPVYSAADTRPPAPEIYVERNQLRLDGRALTMGDMLRYDFIAISRLDTYAFDPAKADEEDIRDALWKVPYVTIIPSPTDFGSGSFIVETNLKITIMAGDYIMVRRKADGTGRPSHWKIIQIAEEMLAFSTTATADDLPGLTVTATDMKVTPKNLYTPYEYAIIPQGAPSGYVPEWILIGSATQSADGKTITASFRALSTAYYIRVRVEGDDKAGYLYKQAQGVVAKTPVLSIVGEYIGPLGSSENDGTVWYMSADGGNKWTTVTAQKGDSLYLELGRVFGKKEVNIELRSAKRIPGENDGSGAKPAGSAALVLKRTVKPRPAFPKEAKPTGFAGTANPANWTFSAAPKQLEYLPEGGIQWLMMSSSVGLPLLTASEQSSGIKPSKLQVRIPAQESTGTPASAPKRFSQQKQVKPPALKPDYKREVIKCKSGVYYYAGPEVPVSSAPFKAAGEFIDIAEALDKGYVIYVYTESTGKKSRSAVQTIRLAPRGEAPDYGEGVIIDKAKFKLQKGFEYYGLKAKWGGLGKGEKSGLVRRKATAKHNTKTGTSTGEAASRAIAVGFVYTEDGKNAVSLTMPSRKTLSLTNLSPQDFSLCSMSYSPSTSGTELFLVLDSASAKGGFAIKPELPAKDGVSLVKSIEVTQGSTVIEPKDGVYTFKDVALGTVCTVTLKPEQPDEYRTTKYTITAILPRTAPLYSVAFGTKDGDRGNIRVTLPSPLRFGESRKITLTLVRAVGSTVVHTVTDTLTFSPAAPNKTVYEYDWRAVLAKVGEGLYVVRAVCAGTPGQTSDSQPVTAGLSMPAVLGPAVLLLAEPANKLTPAVGDSYSVAVVTDILGTDLTGSAQFQWYRVSKVNPSDPGTPAAVSPLYSGTLIYPGGSGRSYIVAEADKGYCIEVEVAWGGVVRRLSAFRSVPS